MSKLPSSLPLPIQSVDAAERAYNVILELETRLLALSQRTEETQTDFAQAHSSRPKLDTDLGEQRNLVLCRILGYLLHHTPTDKARASVAEGIIACNGDDGKLLEFGEAFLSFIRFLHSNTAKTRTPPGDRFNRDLRVEDAKGSSVQPKDHWSAKKYALKRDGYRCMITGAFDAMACDQFPEILAELKDSPSGRWAVTQCSHIFAGVMNRDTDVDKSNWSASVSTILEKFGYTCILDELQGPNVHRLENVMTLDPNIQGAFHMLRLWFAPSVSPPPLLISPPPRLLIFQRDPNAEPNTYELEAPEPFIIKHFPKIVRFQSSDPENLPLPSPRYLEIHAAFARIAHLAGATDYIDRIMRDLEDKTVLANDGSSGELLKHLLKQASPRERRESLEP
ncbi:hypothetical protein CC1G_13484 [Coprinopsis cinerea okayama7|uniref:HNH nuclease domain-containing protein n=1 Tax=Coprinopsis cinerea (strain Okayama-7 / 130 / ATCC MYA-4618 / FGSC 9003) TaxID=240176 RepID=A8PEI3_COPC7|nr:hypothetical protein CC1G_13484 [Coprinopsis cinerea okayama7\|eukprot:XP_001840799.1 hypothetical protein CC1G_13484 [Coprinopsis cinerea okayama7\